MQRIRKGAAPPELAVLGAVKKDWSELRADEKEPVLRALLVDQKGVCAYCMRRIDASRDADGQPVATIEHWHARSDGGPHFDWANLLAVCSGRFDGVLICDKYRGDRPLTHHPARTDPDLDTLVTYGSRDGELHIGDSDDPARLNLNQKLLKRNRVAVQTAFLQWYAKADTTTLRGRLAVLDEGPDLPEYAGVLRHLLRRAIRHRESKGRRLRDSRRRSFE